MPPSFADRIEIAGSWNVMDDDGELAFPLRVTNAGRSFMRRTGYRARRGLGDHRPYIARTSGGRIELPA